ncbi:MAG TPA: aminotransferase class V-fold PLP-dependent enzyme [Marmoricola sp.]|nr:aminotransferase class V-fold PLP-dependent enzyme [Marmoricola sp.]
MVDHERCYLDSASGEALHPAAREVLLSAHDRGYADPRRLHLEARHARLLLDNARAVVAESLAVRPDEVTFTPSGTHAVHLGVLGLLAGRARQGDRLLASAVEHSSVLHAGQWHAARGGTFETVPVDAAGRVSPGDVRAAGPAAVVACQSANHEVGTAQPVAEVVEAAGEAPVFVDACASGGRTPLPEGWSAAALSAHKWGGPAGVGVLLVRKGARWRNPFPGDDRVDERATGFEDVPGALAAAAALQAMTAEAASLGPRQHALVARVRAAASDIPDTEVVGDPDARLPHLITFSCLYVDGEAIVTELDRLGFAVASGSACTASTLEPSHVLAAMGALTHGNVRVSLGRETTEADVDRFLAVLPGVVARIRQAVGM